MIPLDRSQLIKTQALLHEAYDDFGGALVLYRRDPRLYQEYLRDAIKELECAVRTLGGKIEWPSVRDPATEVEAMVSALGLSASPEHVDHVRSVYEHANIAAVDAVLGEQQ